MKRVHIKTPAKINLFLRVLERRPDGYHNIETIFQAVDLQDELIIEKTSDASVLTVPGFSNLENEENLVTKAIRRLELQIGRDLPAKIELNKNIPVAAGLGGGSTDAAAALIGVCSLFNLDLSEGAIYEVARSLGADVPFFLNGGSAVGEEVGDVLTPIDLPLDYSILLVNPGFSVSTAAVYQELSSSLTGLARDGKLWTMIQEHQHLEDLLHNDLQAVAEGLYPEISEVRIFLKRNGLNKTLISGSGPTVFAIGASDQLSRVAGILPDKWRAWIVNPIQHGPTIS
ncbi:MAG: 4-(cytidine 5'-diphospho)-2-C-methyl-D-erythritol kinase [Desulfomonilaceae bacterium]